jgi:acyl-CoA synthetase (AMP-forming)/AMP-acid ligase II
VILVSGATSCFIAINSLAGAVGEMLVEGPTLARGYLNNPEKTAEAFIYDPSWATDTNEAGEKRRFYKSGDLVRYNSAQGALTYIGRKDTQVKLHGQRVELGEIETRLTADVDIQLAVVYVPKSGYAQGKLVTVFCFAGANHTEVRELLLEHASEQRVTGLRQRIGTVLPTYMVPGIWLSVESLPLLSSGKLDRKKVARWLEEMDEDPQFTLNGDEEVDPSLYTPANETEKLLAEAWSRVLNIPVHFDCHDMYKPLQKGRLWSHGAGHPAPHFYPRSCSAHIGHRNTSLLRREAGGEV